MRPQGRPGYLMAHEDDALIAFVQTMKRAGTYTSRLNVQQAAFTLRQQCVPDIEAPSRM